MIYEVKSGISYDIKMLISKMFLTASNRSGNMDTDNFHTEMMTRAIEHSKKATQDPSRYEPFGAVIVRNSDRKILGEGCNNMREMMDPSLHGEVYAFLILNLN